MFPIPISPKLRTLLPLFKALAHDGSAAFEALRHLVRGHGRAMEEVARTASHFQVDDAPVFRKVEVHAGIHYLEREAVLAAEEIDAARALRMREVADLLPRHFLGRDAYAFLDDAVVACKDDILGMTEFRRKGLLDQADLQREFFQPAERTLGLGEIVDFRLQRGAQGLVGTFDMEFHLNL